MPRRTHSLASRIALSSYDDATGVRMVFSSSIFLFAFLPAFLLLYFLTPTFLRSLTIAAGSFVFYGWWKAEFVLLLQWG